MQEHTFCHLLSFGFKAPDTRGARKDFAKHLDLIRLNGVDASRDDQQDVRLTSSSSKQRVISTSSGESSVLPATAVNDISKKHDLEVYVSSPAPQVPSEASATPCQMGAVAVVNWDEVVLPAVRSRKSISPVLAADMVEQPDKPHSETVEPTAARMSLAERLGSSKREIREEAYKDLSAGGNAGGRKSF